MKYYNYKEKNYYFPSDNMLDNNEEISGEMDIEQIRRQLKYVMRDDIANDYALKYILSQVKIEDIKTV